MTDSIRPTSGPIPFARKGEASPAVDHSARSSPRVVQAPTQDLPATGLLAEKPREEAHPARLTSLIRHVSHKGSARAATPTTPALTYSSPWSAPARAPAAAPRARAAEAPAQSNPGQLIHRAPPATGPSHVALEIGLHRRRQLTLRLTTAEFVGLHTFAKMTGSTYQDILARAVRLFLAAMMPRSTAVEDKAVVEPPTETHHPRLRLLP